MFNKTIKELTPVQILVFGYALYIFCIFLPLCLPFTWQIDHIHWLDNLFMATSAVSTTGLVTVNTPDAYNCWGQLILLVGFQIGGLGYMTFGSFAILASRGQVSETRLRIGRAIFSMPDHFETVSFIRRAVIFSVSIEFLGFVGLYYAFSKSGLENPIWPAFFHSISAFCTAGFSVFPNSLESYRSDLLVNAIISLLSILGAIGFIVISDLWLSLKNKAYRISLTSKVILVATCAGLLFGTVTLYFDPLFRLLPPDERILGSFFQSMTALTTVGFNTYPIGTLSYATLLVMIILMILGASPSGTGGGLKSTSWFAGLAAIWSMLRNRKQTTFFGSVIPNHRVQAAFATFTLYLMFFAIGCFLLLLSDKHQFEDAIFEVASGLGTVGLSRGITGNLSDLGKATIIGLIYIGRVGVVSLAFAALSRYGNDGSGPTKKEDIVV